MIDGGRRGKRKVGNEGMDGSQDEVPRAASTSSAAGAGGAEPARSRSRQLDKDSNSPDRSSKRGKRVRSTEASTSGRARNGVQYRTAGRDRADSLRSPQQEDEDVRERVGDYLPALPDELGQLCLSRVPRSRLYSLALVCKRWKNYLLGPEIIRARRLHAVREDWVFILSSNADKQWRAYRPEVDGWVKIPQCPSDYVFDSCDKESMVAGLSLMVLGQGCFGYTIWRFDTITSKWSIIPKMHTDRCLFGSASFGQYAYFAGGCSRGTEFKSVERYNSDSNSWELLPDMHTERKMCSGFVMDGKFHVIGGLQNTVKLNSCEVFDPETRSWTVIENMWPTSFVANNQVAPPLVAVLNNELYAINIIENMLMSYDKDHNQWILIEKLPYRAENTNGWGFAFKAVGQELFVIGGAQALGQFYLKFMPTAQMRDRTTGGGLSPIYTQHILPTAQL